MRGVSSGGAPNFLSVKAPEHKSQLNSQLLEKELPGTAGVRLIDCLRPITCGCQLNRIVQRHLSFALDIPRKQSPESSLFRKRLVKSSGHCK